MLLLKKTKITFLILFLLLSLYPLSITTNPTNSSNLTYSPRCQDPLKILFIGSSYFNFNNLPGLFKNLVNNAGKDVYIESCGKNGLYLYDHAVSISTELKINETNWDFVILQGVGIRTAYPENFESEPVDDALITLREKILSNNPSTKILFCLPWAYEDGMAWADGWVSWAPV